jgi:DNA-directed RNA polymerase subunit RPC12/RpoP
MAFKSDSPAYTRIVCPNCGREKIIASWKLNSMARDAGIEVTEWSHEWFGKRMRCTRCQWKGMVLSWRG